MAKKTAMKTAKHNNNFLMIFPIFDIYGVILVFSIAFCRIGGIISMPRN